MVKSCASYGCTNRQVTGSGVSYHRFPVEKNIRKRWILATRRKNFIPSKYCRICSDHFDESAYEKPGTLRKDAIPTVFNFPSHMVTSQPKKRRIIVRKSKSPDRGEREIVTTNFELPLPEAVPMKEEGCEEPHPHLKHFASKSVQCDEAPPYLKLVTSKSVQCDEPPQHLKPVSLSRGVQCSEEEFTAAADVKSPSVLHCGEKEPPSTDVGSLIALHREEEPTTFSEPSSVNDDRTNEFTYDLLLSSLLSSENEERVNIPDIKVLLDSSSAVPRTPTKSKLRREVKLLNKRLKRRSYKIKNMKDIIDTLKKNSDAPQNLIEILENKFSGLPLHLFLNKVENKSKSKHKNVYSEQMKEFALTLYFYSPKAYTYMKTINFGLPHPSTLRKWISRFQCAPGFLEEVFLYMKTNVNEKQHLKHVNLVFDGMSIRKQVIFDAQKGQNVGYVDMGGLTSSTNEEELATEALVFQIVSIKENFKCVVGYFFINKLGAIELSQLIKIAILHEVGVKVANVTFDGTSTNIRALNLLGCKLPEKSFFTLDDLDHNITVMLDPAHMMKLCRNTLADKKQIESEKGIVNFKYIQYLNDLQKKEGLTFKNKLSDKHIHVKLAAQTVSSSVADAIEYLCLIERQPLFEGSMPTVKFIRKIDTLFYYLNSRNPFGKGSTSPIKLDNKDSDDRMLCDAVHYLSQLKIEGIPILHHPRKTFALGFMTCINSVRILRDNLLKSGDFEYLLTYKFSQDHIELTFSCIRGHNGRNDNPNVQQFRWTLRKLMFRISVRPSVNGNCLEFDECRNDVNMSILPYNFIQSVEKENESDDLSDISIISEILENYEYSFFKDNILYYLSGYIARKIKKKLRCEECVALLITDETDLSPYTHFCDFVTKGGLLRASNDVFKIVKFCHQILTYQTKIPTSIDANKMMCHTYTNFRGNLFEKHSTKREWAGNSHEYVLIKMISNLSAKVICHHLAKNRTIDAATPKQLGVRQKLTKIVTLCSIMCRESVPIVVVVLQRILSIK